ncbi:MAG: SufE family protein [Verrucomicrobiae bacterium]|nr:SufE family protein [Verrucomicrobiae bacterium]
MAADLKASDGPEAGILAGREAALATTLASLNDPRSRVAWLVERARHQPPLPDALRLAGYQVPGCQVRFWWIAEHRDGCCWFRSDSDAVTLRAMGRLWSELASGATPRELAGWHPDFLERLGVLRPLATSRQETVRRIGDLIRSFAALHVHGPP